MDDNARGVRATLHRHDRCPPLAARCSFILACWNVNSLGGFECPTSSLWIATSCVTSQRSCTTSPILQSRNIRRAYRAEVEDLIRLCRRRSGRTDETAFLRGSCPRRSRPGATHEFALGHGDPCRPVFSSSFRSAGSPLGFCRARKPAAGVSRPLSRRVAAGTADLGKAGPRPARGLKALLVRKPASLDPAAPDPEAPVFPPVFLDRTRREDRQEPAQAFRAKPKERIFP